MAPGSGNGLGVNCTVLEGVAIPLGSRWDEELALKYLCDLRQFLLRAAEGGRGSRGRTGRSGQPSPPAKTVAAEAAAPNPGVASPLYLSLATWVRFERRFEDPFVSPSEQNALWALFSAIYADSLVAGRADGGGVVAGSNIAGGKGTRGAGKSGGGGRAGSGPSAAAGAAAAADAAAAAGADASEIPFHIFGVLFLLQTRRSTGAARAQLMSRLLRSTNNGLVFSNAAAAAAHASISGGLISPRSAGRAASACAAAAAAAAPHSSIGPLLSPRRLVSAGRTETASAANFQGAGGALVSENHRAFVRVILPSLVKFSHSAFAQDADGRPDDENGVVVLKLLDLCLFPLLFDSLPSLELRSNANARGEAPYEVALSTLREAVTVDAHRYPFVQRQTAVALWSVFGAAASGSPSGSPGGSGFRSGGPDSNADSNFPSSPAQTPGSASHSLAVASFATRKLPSLNSGRPPLGGDDGAIFLEGHRKEFFYIGPDPAVDLLNVKSRRGATSSSALVGGPQQAQQASHSAQPSFERALAGTVTRRASLPGYSTQAVKAEILSSVFLYELYDCTFYILRPVRYLFIQGCRTCRVIAPVVAAHVSIVNSTDIALHVTTRSMKLENCYETTVNALSVTPPVICGDSRGVTLGPYGGIFSKTAAQQAAVRLSIPPAAVNLFSRPVVVSRRGTATLAESHDGRERGGGEAAASPAGTAGGCSSYALQPPDNFTTFAIPELPRGPEAGPSEPAAPLMLPEVYATNLEERRRTAELRAAQIQQLVRNAEDPAAVAKTLHAHFIAWSHQKCHSSRELVDLARIDLAAAKLRKANA